MTKKVPEVDLVIESFKRIPGEPIPEIDFGDAERIYPGDPPKVLSGLAYNRESLLRSIEESDAQNPHGLPQILFYLKTKEVK
jgi:hypothetical protein